MKLFPVQMNVYQYASLSLSIDIGMQFIQRRMMQSSYVFL